MVPPLYCMVSNDSKGRFCNEILTQHCIVEPHLMVSNNVRWTSMGAHRMAAPWLPVSDISGRTLLLRFLHSYLHCLQIDAGWAPRGQIGELIFAPRVSG